MNIQARARLAVGTTVAFILLFALFSSACAPKNEEHLSFDTPDAAVAALVQAFDKDDTVTLQHLFGPGSAALLDSGDAVQDKNDRAAFLTAYRAGHALVENGDDTMTLVIGEAEWPLPVPISKRNGRWQFDGDRGADELVYRRIGANELGAIAVCRGFVEAQREYAASGRDGDSAGVYALKLVSDQGMQNGLYWPTAEDEAPSPAGPFVAAAAAEGYRRGDAPQPYHGYFYRLLYRQGEHANGGALEYFKDGRMTEGFALVAWPAEHQVSGVMTFIVSQDGVVFQKDLGEGTEAAAAAMVAFDPGSSWVVVTEAPGT